MINSIFGHFSVIYFIALLNVNEGKSSANMIQNYISVCNNILQSFYFRQILKCQIHADGQLSNK